MGLFSKAGPELVYEEYSEDFYGPSLQAIYNELGVIETVFVRCSLGLVKVDLEHLEQRNPDRYNYLQSRINEALSYTQKES